MNRKHIAYIIICALLTSLVLSLPCAALAESSSGAEVYREDVKEYTFQDCASCHFPVYTTLKEKGGKHKLVCKECHVTYHNFGPDMTWEEKMPACSDCHDETHGPEYPDCTACHQDGHAPIESLKNMERLSQNCGDCHAQQGAEISQNISAHTDVACGDCHHTRHGYKPDCTECHPSPHTAYTAYNECAGCHPVHSPLDIALGPQVDNNKCSGCHEAVYEKSVGSAKKHGLLRCVLCHAYEHGSIPTCQDCHNFGPHKRPMVEQFGVCADCHGDPHNLRLEGY